VGLAVVGAVADDLAGVVDALGGIQYPAGVLGDQFVQVFGFCAGGDEGVISGFKGELADYGAGVVEGESPTDVAEVCRYVFHYTFGPEEGVGVAVEEVSDAGNLIFTIDGIALAP